jgi:SAM-dependent methyltransferase
VSRLSKPESKILDVGSYVGHDLRALYFAGVPQSALYGLDLLPFWNLGYELFNDRGKFTVKTVLGDILDFNPESPAAQLLDGKMDVVWSSAVIHQFPWDKQVLACKRLIQFSKGSGALIAGCGVGSSMEDIEGELDTEAITKGKYKGQGTLKHNVASMERMWNVVGEDLGIKLDVSVNWKSFEDYGCQEGRCVYLGEGMGVLGFTVKLE